MLIILKWKKNTCFEKGEWVYNWLSRCPYIFRFLLYFFLVFEYLLLHLIKSFILFHQVTKGGALTLVSLWKSQFDDSEETTDNEWKQEQLQVIFNNFKVLLSHLGKKNTF